MLSSMVKWLKCDSCNSHNLFYNYTRTFEAYSLIDSISIEKASDFIDNALNQYLIFECTDCGAEYRFTFKELEKRLRTSITTLILLALNRKEMVQDHSFLKKHKFFTYCGKCLGHTGNGCCPIEVYDICKLKRLPNV